MNSVSSMNELRMPMAAQSYRARATLTPPPPADPDDPHLVFRSHLKKDQLGKSSGTCKLSMVFRMHRRSVLQEFWCASYEEACVFKCLAAHPDVVNFEEQRTRVDFIADDGRATFTRVDAHVLLRNWEEVLFSVKYDQKARRLTYLREIESISRQAPRSIADRFAVASRFSFHAVYRECARQIHLAKSGWDPEADRIVLSSANDLPPTFRFEELVGRSGLGPRAYRAAIRLIGDGDLRKHLLDPIKPDTLLTRELS